MKTAETTTPALPSLPSSAHAVPALADHGTCGFCGEDTTDTIPTPTGRLYAHTACIHAQLAALGLPGLRRVDEPDDDAIDPEAELEALRDDLAAGAMKTFLPHFVKELRDAFESKRTARARRILSTVGAMAYGAADAMLEARGELEFEDMPDEAPAPTTTTTTTKTKGAPTP